MLRRISFGVPSRDHACLSRACRHQKHACSRHSTSPSARGRPADARAESRAVFAHPSRLSLSEMQASRFTAVPRRDWFLQLNATRTTLRQLSDGAGPEISQKSVPPSCSAPGTGTSAGIPCFVRMPARLLWRHSRALRRPDGWLATCAVLLTRRLDVVSPCFCACHRAPDVVYTRASRWPLAVRVGRRTAWLAFFPTCSPTGTHAGTI